MEATVGIISYLRPAMLERCLEAVRNQTVKPAKVDVYESSEERVPQPVARNAILGRCETEIIAFLDDDSIPTSRWLEGIIGGYSDPKVAGVGGPCINVDNNGQVLEKIIRDQKNRNYFKTTGDVRCDGRRWIPPKAVETQIMLGGNMSFLTERLREIGGFDEHYSSPAFREETDPQVALIKEGYKFIYEPRALVWHVKTGEGGESGFVKALDYFRWCGASHKYFCDKYFSKLKSRLSWIFFSISPPCLWLTLALTIARRDRRYLGWIRGLWF